MTDAKVGRLLIHPAGQAGWNMAVDQAIAESISASASSASASSASASSKNSARPTLRFYTWAEPTLSLGYFQTSKDASPRFDSIRRVRRSTGGGAILHHHELTYSLTIPTKAGQHGARHDLYRDVHAAIIQELDDASVVARRHADAADLNKAPQQDVEPFLCFQRRTSEDLIVSGYKVLGSAQRRSRRAVLQHGSLLLRASDIADELPGVYDLTSIDCNPINLAPRLAKRLGNLLDVTFQSGQLTSSETEAAARICAQRFDNDDWWSRR